MHEAGRSMIYVACMPQQQEEAVSIQDLATRPKTVIRSTIRRLQSM